MSKKKNKCYSFLSWNITLKQMRAFVCYILWSVLDSCKLFFSSWHGVIGRRVPKCPGVQDKQENKRKHCFVSDDVWWRRKREIKNQFFIFLQSFSVSQFPKIAMFQTCMSMNSIIRNNHTNSFELTSSVRYITNGGTTSKILLSMMQCL